jgi:hypothetical protein
MISSPYVLPKILPKIFMLHSKFSHHLAPRHGILRGSLRTGSIALLTIAIGGSLSGLSGCTSTAKFKPEMTMQVTPEGQTGLYTLKGKTNLPQPEVEKRKQPIVITVQAIRLLVPKANAKKLVNTQPIHAVIARQRIETLDGNWEVKLNLLNPNPKGAPLEVWQLNAGDVPADLEPSPNVTFLAATDSIDRTLDFTSDVNKTSPDGQKPVLQSAKDGSLFLQSELTQSIAPPALPKMAATGVAPIVQVPAQSISEKSATKQNSAPLLPKENMR